MLSLFLQGWVRIFPSSSSSLATRQLEDMLLARMKEDEEEEEKEEKQRGGDFAQAVRWVLLHSSLSETSLPPLSGSFLYTLTCPRR